MSITSKSPKDVLLSAWSVAQQSLRAYSHRFSPKKFTQHQLFAVLVLKNFLRTDYHGVVAYLQDCQELAATIELHQIPHFTTLQKASRRLLAMAAVRSLLDETVRRQMGRRTCVPTAAIDSTGMDCGCASAYFVKRRKKVGEAWKQMVYHRYPKLGVVCDTDNHFIFAYEAHRGPKPDVNEFESLVQQTLNRIRMKRIVADAGYDSEGNHTFARDKRQVRSRTKRGQASLIHLRKKNRRHQVHREETMGVSRRRKFGTLVGK